jgi:hypothetical protein
MTAPRLLLACVGMACLVAAMFPSYVHTELENGGWVTEFRLGLPFSPLVELREETVKQVIKHDPGQVKLIGLDEIAFDPGAKAETTVSQHRTSGHVEYFSWSAALFVVALTLLTVALKPRVLHVPRPAAGQAEGEARGPT